jgi:hypothetical protein
MMETHRKSQHHRLSAGQIVCREWKQLGGIPPPHRLATAEHLQLPPRGMFKHTHTHAEIAWSQPGWKLL